ncbi:MAG: hypothetical protein QG657_2942 [Acidobacteriota bacterium]|nr:hypothetical protein [Acidobacteriota bacterium]
MTNDQPMTPAKRHIIYTLIAVLISVLILFVVYAIVDKEADSLPTPVKAEERFKEIETPAKKWLNGHFGIFFRFKYLGNINWLIIPLLIYFFLAVKKPRRWQMALVFTWLLTALFIIIKGYTNFRYQFTLFPFTVTIILLLLWEISKDKKIYIKILCFSFVGLACAYNIYHYFDRYNFYWDIKVNEEKSRFPYQLIDYLNRDRALKESSKKVFALNQPLFFYYTNQKGIDMQSPQAQWATAHLTGNIGSREALFKEFKKILHVEYILLSASHLKFYQSGLLPEFLDCECRLVLKDNGWLLYRLREKPLERELKSPGYGKVKLWRPQQKQPGNNSSRFIIFTEKGKFTLEDCRVKERTRYIDCLAVRNNAPDENGQRILHFGYEFGRGILKMEPIQPRGRYIHFIVRVTVPPKLCNKENYVFISEYDGHNKNWQSTKVYFSSPNWRTYIVSRKIAPDSQRVLLGLRFTPQSPDHSLVIQDTRLYVSDNPI